MSPIGSTLSKLNVPVAKALHDAHLVRSVMGEYALGTADSTLSSQLRSQSR